MRVYGPVRASADLDRRSAGPRRGVGIGRVEVAAVGAGYSAAAGVGRHPGAVLGRPAWRVVLRCVAGMTRSFSGLDDGVITAARMTSCAGGGHTPARAGLRVGPIALTVVRRAACGLVERPGRPSDSRSTGTLRRGCGVPGGMPLRGRGRALHDRSLVNRGTLRRRRPGRGSRRRQVVRRTPASPRGRTTPGR